METGEAESMVPRDDERLVLDVDSPVKENLQIQVPTASTDTESDHREHLCPRGHILETNAEKCEGEGTCDVCHYSFGAGEEYLMCWECEGFAVCSNCTEKSHVPNLYSTSLDQYDLGMKGLEKGSYDRAAEHFQSCLDACKELVEKKWDVPDDALAARSAKYIQIANQKKQWLQEGMDNIQKEDDKAANTGGVSSADTTDASTATDGSGPPLLGVSVYHLQTTFLARVRVASLGDSSKIHEIENNLRGSQGSRGRETDGVAVAPREDETNLNDASNIHRIENLQGPPGVIRKRGMRVVCPIDGKMGAAYVNCLEGEDNVGEATHMLSYSWSYKIGDIVDSLTDYCVTHNLDPKRTYVWICCLCINQHRVVEQKETGGTGMLNFEEEFPRKLNKIGHMLAMMAPWQAPFYLTRLWCVFEMYAADTNGCKVDIVMPPQEKESLEQDVINEGGGIDALWEALGNTNVKNANATVQSDKEVILGMIESTVGCQVLNNKVNELLRAWMKQVLVDSVEKRENTHDESHADFCSQAGEIMWCNGEYDGALEQYQKCLAIEEELVGTNHMSTAITYGCIGNVLSDKGDYDGALEQYQKCLAIQERVLGTDHPDTAKTHSCIGSALDNKGDYEGALEKYRKCLAVEESVLGTDHPDTAITYRNIGRVLCAKGDCDASMEQFKKCLAIQESVLGTNHPDTAKTHSCIGSALDDKGDYEGALEKYRKCLAIEESVLGTDHPDTAITINNIGWVLNKKGDYDASMEQFKKCFAIQESFFDADHPDIASTHRNIGLVMCNKGDYDGALEQHRKCLAIQERAWGTDHPLTVATCDSISFVRSHLVS